MISVVVHDMDLITSSVVTLPELMSVALSLKNYADEQPISPNVGLNQLIKRIYTTTVVALRATCKRMSRSLC